MARRGGRLGPRGRSDNNGRNGGYRSTNPGHQGDQGNQDRSKGYKSFHNPSRSDNRYKKINNIPGNRRNTGGQDSGSTSKVANETYRITIPQGQKHERDLIIQKIRASVGEDFAFFNYEKHTGNSTFYVVGRELAENIKSMSRRISLDNGFQLVMLTQRSRIEEVQINDEVKEVMKRAIALRYNRESNVVSLVNIVNDPEFKNTGLFLPASKKNVLEAIMNIIVENIPDVVAINLSSNRIYSLDPLKLIVTSCPNVKAIDLSKNSISQKMELKILSQLALVELNIEGNPFCEKFKNTAEMKSFIQEIFPTLKKLDGDDLDEKVSFGVTDAEVLRMIQALPPPVQYSVPSEVEGFVMNFVKQYFETFDSPDRANISAVYGPNSIMTYSYSNLSKRNDGSGRSSHNLLRLTDESLYNRYAHFGSEFIMRFFKDFPQLKHHFETFTIDVPIVEGETMLVCINGQVTEIMKDDKPRLAFSRMWMIAYVDGRPIIQNDSYHLSSLSHVAQLELQSKPKGDMEVMPLGMPQTIMPIQQSAMPSAMPTAMPTVMPTVQPAMPILQNQPIITNPTGMSTNFGQVTNPPIQSITAPAAPITSNIGGDPRAEAVQKFMSITNMVQSFAVKCLEEAGYDQNKAYEMYKNAFSKLPPEAFRT